MSVLVGVFSLAVLIGFAIKAGKRTAQAAQQLPGGKRR